MSQCSFVADLCRGCEPIRERSLRARPGGLTLTGGAIRILGRERVDGSECVVIEQEREAVYRGSVRSRVVVRSWVCPRLGYAVPRTQGWGRSPKTGTLALWSESRTEYRQYGRGAWGPVSVNFIGYDFDGSGAPIARTRIAYQPGFRVNVPEKSLDLKLRLPSGIKVFDLDNGGFRKVP